MTRGAALIATLIISSPVVLTAGCETTAQAVAHQENSLSAAGFVDRPANTPQRQAMLARLPPHKFIRRTHGDTVSYVYADPTDCRCLYVGTQQAYANYRKVQAAKNIAEENEMASMNYEDASWNWGGWGGWGPGFGPEYGFGPGYGW